MARGALFGRRIRITLGGLILADIDPARPLESQKYSLDCTFETEAHTKLEPMPTRVTVRGLNRRTRAALLEQQKAAATESWEDYQKVLTGALLVEEEEVFQVQQQLVFEGLQLRIEAGYQDDFALIANAQTMPNGIEHEYAGGYVTSIQAQDGRYPWQNGFVSEPVAPGVTFRDWKLIEELSAGFLEGTQSAEQVQAKVPELLQRKDVPGYANGRVLYGDQRNLEQQIAETLGLTLFFDRGQRVYLDLNAVTQDEAVVLRLVGRRRDNNPAPGGLLEYKIQSRGFVSARCLLNYRLTPGRQVFLRDEQDKPIGEGVFRVDYVRHSGSTFDQTFNSEVTLRPTNVSVANNV